MAKITYTLRTNQLDYVVKLDGKTTGFIRRGSFGWRYQPKGSKKYGEASHSLDVVKRSLETATECST